MTGTCSGNRARAAESPFCFNCGYNLTGLDLPQPCPECGRMADLLREIEGARQWFGAEAWKPWACLWPSSIPLALWHALADGESRRIARRRRRWCLWIPAALTTILVFVGSMFESRSRSWLQWRAANNPGGMPLHQVEGVERRRVFTYQTGEFTYDPYTPPAGATETTQADEWTKWEFRPHMRFSTMTLSFGLAPWFLSIAGFLFAAYLICGAVAVRGRPYPSGAVLAVASVIVPAYGIILWTWLILTVVSGLLYLRGERFAPIGPPPVGFFLFPTLAWLVVSILAWRSVVGRERSGHLLPHRAWTAALLAVSSIALPWIAAAVFFRFYHWATVN